jgi:hypothetical protein
MRPLLETASVGHPRPLAVRLAARRARPPIHKGHVRVAPDHPPAPAVRSTAELDRLAEQIRAARFGPAPLRIRRLDPQLVRRDG